MTAVLEPTTTNPYGLVRGAAVLHLPACPHIAKWGAAEPPTAGELTTWDTCTWSQAEIDGVGRTYYKADALEAAMSDFGSYAGTKQLIRNALRGVDFDEIWIPNSSSYIALGKNSYAVAWVHLTYVVANGQETLLPGFVSRSHSGGDPEPNQGQVCRSCTLQMPLTGVCDNCD